MSTATLLCSMWLFHLADPWSSSLANSSSVPCEVRLKWASQKCPGILGQLDACFGLSFSHWRKHRLRWALSVWSCASLREGQHGQNHSFYPSNAAFLSFVLQDTVSASFLGSEIFTEVFLSVDSC